MYMCQLMCHTKLHRMRVCIPIPWSPVSEHRLVSNWKHLQIAAPSGRTATQALITHAVAKLGGKVRCRPALSVPPVFAGLGVTSKCTGLERKYSCKPAGRVQIISALDRYAVEIQPLGLRLWRIGGDGRCMFRALAQGAYQLDKGQPLKVAEEQHAADELRKCICNKLCSRQDDISPFLEVPFQQYIESMSQASTWGGEPELSVTPECLLRPVDVYMNGATGLQVMSNYSSPDCKHSEPVKVLFNGKGHYDLLVDNSPMSKL